MNWLSPIANPFNFSFNAVGLLRTNISASNGNIGLTFLVVAPRRLCQPPYFWSSMRSQFFNPCFVNTRICIMVFLCISKKGMCVASNSTTHQPLTYPYPYRNSRCEVWVKRKMNGMLHLYNTPAIDVGDFNAVDLLAIFYASLTAVWATTVLARKVCCRRQSSSIE